MDTTTFIIVLAASCLIFTLICTAIVNIMNNYFYLKAEKEILEAQSKLSCINNKLEKEDNTDE